MTFHLSYVFMYSQFSVHGGMGDHSLRKSTSTVLSGPTTGVPPHPEPPSFIDRLKSEGI